MLVVLHDKNELRHRERDEADGQGNLGQVEPRPRDVPVDAPEVPPGLDRPHEEEDDGGGPREGRLVEAGREVRVVRVPREGVVPEDSTAKLLEGGHAAVGQRHRPEFFLGEGL